MAYTIINKEEYKKLGLDSIEKNPLCLGENCVIHSNLVEWKIGKAEMDKKIKDKKFSKVSLEQLNSLTYSDKEV